MKRERRLVLAVTVAVSIGGGTAMAAAAPLTDGRLVSGEVLFWNQAQRDANFPRMERLVGGHVVHAGGAVRMLRRGRDLESALGGRKAVADLMTALNIAGLLVLQDGRVRLERYARGYSRRGRWTSFSVAKSITSTLVGAAVRDGYIRSVDDPVTRYIPELAESAYQGVSIREVLMMTSGVRWNEDYTDRRSDVVRIFADTPPPGQNATIAYLRRLPRDAAPGSKWVYKTGETSLIGVLVSRATGRTLADYLSEKIWRPYGMERDAFWQTEADGQEMGGCCLSASLRDYGRFGQFILDGGRAGGRPVLAEGWTAAATSVRWPLNDKGGYGYFWWTDLDGSYRALGIFGQMIHIDPSRRLVIVTSSAWPRAAGDALAARRARLIAAISKAVDAAPSNAGNAR